MLDLDRVLNLTSFTFIFREDETDLVFPKEDFKPLSTLCPPAVPE